MMGFVIEGNGELTMNKDLISRSALSEKLQAHHDFFVNAWGGFNNLPTKDKARVDEITHCIAEVMNAPVVDAVIPVRCKECIHRDGTPGQPNIVCRNMKEDDFCSYGERKEG